MTFGTIESRAREYARVATSGVSQATIFEYINEGIVEFARDAKGLPYEEYLTLSEAFDLETHQAFHLTIIGSSNNDIDSDIVVTSADASNQTGAQTATMLQSQIRDAIGGGADLTVTWAKYYFTVDAIDSTSISITGPDDEVTYDNYVAELFGSEQSGITSITGNFPRDCTIESTLSADSIRVNRVLWDNYLLQPVSRGHVVDSGITGDPAYYNVRGNKIRVVPVPTEQEKWYIEYKGVPSQISSPTDSSDIPDIPEKYQRAIAYWVAFQLLLGTFEDSLANRRYAEYKRIVNQYRADYANNDTKMTTDVPVSLQYTVEGS